MLSKKEQRSASENRFAKIWINQMCRKFRFITSILSVRWDFRYSLNTSQSWGFLNKLAGITLFNNTVFNHCFEYDVISISKKSIKCITSIIRDCIQQYSRKVPKGSKSCHWWMDTYCIRQHKSLQLHYSSRQAANPYIYRKAYQIRHKSIGPRFSLFCYCCSRMCVSKQKGGGGGS